MRKNISNLAHFLWVFCCLVIDAWVVQAWTSPYKSVPRTSFGSTMRSARTALYYQNASVTLTEEMVQTESFPGLHENEFFDCDASVELWRDFQADPNDPPTAQENLQSIRKIADRFRTEGGTNGSLYFAKHISRTLYFAVNALLGDAAFQWSGASPQRGGLPLGMSSAQGSRLVLEALMCYEQDYFDHISKGIYKEPWDMESLTHRQSSPRNVLTQTSRFVREAVGTLGRRARGKDQDKQVKFFQSVSKITSNYYPEYYQTAFHYQGDGWMSTESANVYETSTETLFLGRQDSMQRTTLPPLLKVSKRIPKNRPMRVLEVACGTGRFMTFARDNLPLDAEYTALDLSPFYLEKALDNDAYWVQTRQDSTKTIQPATLVQAPAEKLPFESESFDAVVCVYLFHELPRSVRAMAAAEMARVVAPGGTVVLTDSVQKGDRRGLDHAIGNFEKMNEPYYGDYIRDDLGGHFTCQGLVPGTKMVRSTTKALSFSKPGELS